jgi:hypothetical protein
VELHELTSLPPAEVAATIENTEKQISVLQQHLIVLKALHSALTGITNEPKPRRGRPKGSKAKPKPETTHEAV